MQSLILGALGLEGNKAGNELANVIGRNIKAKSLQRQLPELIDGMARDPSFPDAQRRELVQLMKGKLPKDLVNLSPTQFQERLGRSGVSAPMASSIYLVLELELLNQIEGQGTTIQPIVAKAVKKKWPGSDEVETLAKDWEEALVQRRYDLAHRIQLIQGQSPKLAVSEKAAPKLEPVGPTPDGPRLEPVAKEEPEKGPKGERSGLPELDELTPQAPPPSEPPAPEPVEEPTPEPAPEPGASRDGPLKTYSGKNYKLFIGGKGIPILEFAEQGPGEAQVTTKEPHPVLEDWLVRGDPAVPYVIEKSGSETHPLQGCKVTEGKTVYKLVYRVEK